MAKAMIQAIMSPPPDTGEALSSQVEAALAELCQVGEEMVITSKSLGVRSDVSLVLGVPGFRTNATPCNGPWLEGFRARCKC